jgi:hypothetical protein
MATILKWSWEVTLIAVTVLGAFRLSWDFSTLEGISTQKVLSRVSYTHLFSTWQVMEEFGLRLIPTLLPQLTCHWTTDRTGLHLSAEAYILIFSSPQQETKGNINQFMVRTNMKVTEFPEIYDR